MRNILTFILLLWCASADATDHFSDYAAGSDSNDGLTTGTAWKNVWGMAGATMTYSHVNGDRFIVKGGSTWPNSCFPMTIASAPTSGPTQDFYGTNGSWGTGQAIFDSQHAAIIGANRFINASGVNGNIIFRGIHFTDEYWDSTSQEFGLSAISIGDSTNGAILDCLFDGWLHDTLAHGCNDNLKLIIGSTTTYNHGWVCSNCVFDGSASSGDSGNAGYCFPCFLNCTITNMADALLVNGDPSLVANCIIAQINASYDASVHGAAWEIQGQATTSWFSNNIVHNNASGVTLGVGLAGGAINGPAYIVKNIVWNTSTGVLLKWFSGANNTAHIWNNVIDVSQSPNYGILSEDGTWTTVDAQNNLTIGVNSYSITASGGAVGNNVFWSSAVASANGFTSGNRYYNPANSAAVSPGTSAPSSIFTTDFNGAKFNPWYIGPYAYGGSPVAQAVSITGGGQISITGDGQILIK